MGAVVIEQRSKQQSKQQDHRSNEDDKFIALLKEADEIVRESKQFLEKYHQRKK